MVFTLDSASYAPIQNLSDSNPGINLTYTVRAGDSLQSIAEQMYGNASLWFVIADANDLSASAQLAPGTQLLIPKTIQNGTITADNHKVYSESDIVGSTLPNLKSPPPPHHGQCGSILAIIIVVVIAVVAFYAIAVLGPALSGVFASASGVSTTAGGSSIRNSYNPPQLSLAKRVHVAFGAWRSRCSDRMRATRIFRVSLRS